MFSIKVKDFCFTIKRQAISLSRKSMFHNYSFDDHPHHKNTEVCINIFYKERVIILDILVFSLENVNKNPELQILRDCF